MEKEIMPEIAAGTKVFKRTEKLSNLLHSLERVPIDHVYVADDGECDDERAKLYEQNFTFDLTVIDLEYDAGLGAGRDMIVDQFTEDYLLIVDTDHLIPLNIEALAEILDEDESIGGVAGNIIEPYHRRMYQNSHDLSEEGSTLVRHTSIENKEIETKACRPFVQFDFIPNAALFRRECLDDYSWDSEYTIEKEHLDFYVGHMKQTDWRFGICPEVCFPHYPGGNESYLSNRHSETKQSRSEAYFLEKWGYDDIRTKRSYWFDTSAQSLPERAVEVYRENGGMEVLKRTVEIIPSLVRERL